MALQGYGAVVGIRTNNTAVLKTVLDCLPPGVEPVNASVVDSLFSLYVGPPSRRAGRRNYHLLYEGGARLARAVDLDAVLNVLENYLTLAIAYWADSFLFVHAGVVGWQGQVIVIPGASHSGKTTLVRALIDAGATFYSDEMAVFDTNGYAHPYPLALTVRQTDSVERVPPRALGSRIGQAALPVGVVVDTAYVEGAQWRPRLVQPSRGVMSMIAHTVAIRRVPEMAMSILRKVASGTQVVRSKRGEAGEAAQWILATMSADVSSFS